MKNAWQAAVDNINLKLSDYTIALKNWQDTFSALKGCTDANTKTTPPTCRTVVAAAKGTEAIAVALVTVRNDAIKLVTNFSYTPTAGTEKNNSKTKA